MRPPSHRADLLDAWDRGAARAGARSRRNPVGCSPAAETATGALGAVCPGRARSALAFGCAPPYSARSLTGLVACEACGEPLELDFAVDELLGSPSRMLTDWWSPTDGYARLGCACQTAPTCAKRRRRRRGRGRRCCSAPLRHRADADDGGSVPADGAARGRGRGGRRGRLAEADPLADLRLVRHLRRCGATSARRRSTRRLPVDANWKPGRAHAGRGAHAGQRLWLGGARHPATSARHVGRAYLQMVKV